MPSVCFGGEGRGAAQRYFRGSLPAQSLARRGWRTEVAELVLHPTEVLEIAKDPRLRGGTPVRDLERNIIDVRIHEPCDVMTLRLMDDIDLLDPSAKPGDMPDAIARARRAGQVVLVDLDDDVWNIPEWSPAARQMNRYNPTRRTVEPDVLNANIAAADGVLCSTQRIVDVVKEQVPGARAWLVPNGIDPAVYRWPRRPEEHSPLRVGWMGSLSHHRPHLETMVEALDVLADYGAVFTFMGWTPSYAKEAEELLRSLPCKAGTLPWVDHHQLPEMLAQVDIGIIPRVDTPFNDGQSTTSGLQYAGAGVPFIAYPSQPYRELHDQGVGFLASTVDDWRERLRSLLCSSGLRDSMRSEGRRVVGELYGPKQTGARYEGLFRLLVADKAGALA